MTTDTHQMELPPLPQHVHTPSNEDYARLHALDPSLPTTPEGCKTCGGHGTFRWWDDGRRQVLTYVCPCRDQWILQHFLQNAGIKRGYQTLGWDDLLGHTEQGAIETIADYLDHADGYVRSGIGLILHGARGTGKTSLAALLLKRLLAEHGYDGYMTTFGEMLSTLMGGFDDPEQRKWFHRRVRNVQILVIDDLGLEHKQRRRTEQGSRKHSTPLAESTIDDVLRHRASSLKPTIITTNLDLDQVQQDYGPNVLSLLEESSIAYRFVGVDYRREANLRRREEAQQGMQRPVVVR